MTETDTSREAVKRWTVLRNDSGLGYSDGIAPDKYGGFVDYEAYRALLARAEKAEAERDTAWNDAIEAAADEVTTWHSCDGECVRALKKGEPT